jgi:putative DNA primase/helicase
MLSILEYLCSNEQNHRDLYQWILKWMAYPLQHPGAKMKTALLVHGPQRVGKNFFFETYMAIFGQYGQVIDQDALEDKYNDCFSRKLFLVADEVVARQEMYHVKNKLKGMITGTRIRINPKNVKSYWETNHCNIIFLSNETMPLVLERDDGRFVVLWTPPKLSAEFYKDVEREVDAGGVAALYHYLLNLPLGDFGPHTPPPMTTAKRDLMDLSMDSTERFWIEWSGDQIHPVPCVPVKSTQLYAFYREWCGRCGYPRYAPEPRFLAEITKRTPAKHLVGRYLNGSGARQARFIIPPKQEQPPDKNQAAWLGECIREFTNGVVEWRGENEGE